MAQQFCTNYYPLTDLCYSYFFNNITIGLMTDETKGQRVQQHQGPYLPVVL